LERRAICINCRNTSW